MFYYDLLFLSLYSPSPSLLSDPLHFVSEGFLLLLDSCLSKCVCFFIYLCFLCFFFGSFSSVCLFLSDICLVFLSCCDLLLSLLLLLLLYLDVCWLSKKRKKGYKCVDPKERRDGQDLKGVGGGKTVIRMYRIKNLFSIKKKKLLWKLLINNFWETHSLQIYSL